MTGSVRLGVMVLVVVSLFGRGVSRPLRFSLEEPHDSHNHTFRGNRYTLLFWTALQTWSRCRANGEHHRLYRVRQGARPQAICSQESPRTPAHETPRIPSEKPPCPS